MYIENINDDKYKFIMSPCSSSNNKGYNYYDIYFLKSIFEKNLMFQESMYIKIVFDIVIFRYL